MTHQDGGENNLPARGDAISVPAELVERAFARPAQTDLRDSWLIFWRRRGLVFLCLSISLFCGAIAIRFARPSYLSTATVKFEPPSPGILQAIPSDNPVWGTTLEEMQTQVGLVKSDRVAQRVLEILAAQGGQGEGSETSSFFDRARDRWERSKRDLRSFLIGAPPVSIDPEVAARQRRIVKLQEKVSVQQVRGTKLIEISYRHRRPEMASRTADAYCAAYAELLAVERKAAINQSVRWINQQAQDALATLKEAEKKLLDYRTANDAAAIDVALANAAGNMKRLNESVQELKKRVAVAQAAEEGANSERIKQILLSRSPEYTEMAKTLVALEIRRAPLAARNRPAFPELAQLDVEIAEHKKQMEKQAKQIVRKIQGDSLLANLEIERLTPTLKEEEAKVDRLNTKMAQYRVIQREVDSAAEFHKLMLDHSREYAATAAIEPINVTTISPAQTPVVPNSPQIFFTLLMAAAIGLVAAGALCILLDHVDRSLRKISHIESATRLETLALIPYLGNGRSFPSLTNGKSPRLYLAQKPRPRSISGEIFRYLRASLEYGSGNGNGAPRVIQITSALPSEGKSTVACNLALVFAARGQKTLLIDGDLHRRSLHRVFGVEESPGLSDLLMNKATIDSAIRSTGIHSLDLLTSGRPVVCPVDLFETPRAHELMAQLRKEYSVIILDSAPVLGVADCLVLARMADGACVVVDRGRTSADALRDAVDILQRVEANLLGVIVNTRDKNVLYGDRYYDYGYAHSNGDDFANGDGNGNGNGNGVDHESGNGALSNGESSRAALEYDR